MAGEWIKVRTNLWDDPRIGQLCEMTDQGEAAVIGGLYWLWATADEHSSDGLLTGMTTKTIDRKTGVQGLGAALVAIGWLIENEQGVTVSRFDEHNGASAKQRAQTAKRVANHKDNAKVTQQALAEQQQTVSDALPREDKIREELTSKTLVPGDAGSDQPAPLKPVGKPECPHQAIIELYHEMLPQCPRIRDWTPSRQQHLRARWNEDPKRQSLDYWKLLFEYIGTCDFLVGKSGNTPFFADLEWIVTSKNFTKIREQKYENRKAA